MPNESFPQATTLKKLRFAVLKTVEQLTTEQLNKVPDGFNNNIIWNIAHLIASQQNLCYVKAGQDPLVPQGFIQAYKPGTKPEQQVSARDIEFIKSLLVNTAEQLEADLEDHKFDNYTPWVNGMGLELNNINDIISYLPLHEGIHLGYILALKRLI
ncbi:DinB superfamily protein [Pedobacter steynii]|uniref:DinB superfamily protein n=1 Tax=Pedobacter steynii TaxID=430522 RepID=A0A1H0J8N4_9SPHI|nr:DinB family protein [Pedobacter steynii]NQX43065.1 DinB family protein [Pedobacter steynii]SDO40076.1 DinB superfamily protein [Pedobacter steynii]